MLSITQVVRARRLTGGGSGVLVPSVLALAVLAACTKPAEERDTVPHAGEWRSFEGTWSAVGDLHTLDVGPDRKASFVDLSGSLLLTGERGLGVGFQARAFAYADGAARTVGRAVWIDERGDRIFSELRGAPFATGSTVVGTITGGTGRWSGVSGDYGFEWRYVVEGDGRIQGRAEGLRGRARILPPEGRSR